jgi:hypothetical protein
VQHAQRAATRHWYSVTCVNLIDARSRIHLGIFRGRSSMPHYEFYCLQEKHSRRC